MEISGKKKQVVNGKSWKMEEIESKINHWYTTRYVIDSFKLRSHPVKRNSVTSNSIQHLKEMNTSTASPAPEEDPRKDVSVPFPTEAIGNKGFIEMLKWAYGFGALKPKGYEPPPAPTVQDTEELVGLKYIVPDLENQRERCNEAIEAIRAHQLQWYAYVGNQPVKEEEESVRSQASEKD